MTAGPEARIEREVVRRAKARGWRVYKIGVSTPRGLPDRVFLRAGRTVWIEFKRPGGKAGPQQQRRHHEMRAEGVEVHVVDSIEEADRILA